MFYRTRDVLSIIQRVNTKWQGSKKCEGSSPWKSKNRRLLKLLKPCLWYANECALSITFLTVFSRVREKKDGDCVFIEFFFPRKNCRFHFAIIFTYCTYIRDISQISSRCTRNIPLRTGIWTTYLLSVCILVLRFTKRQQKRWIISIRMQ